jgi:hypothetical protein
VLQRQDRSRRSTCTQLVSGRPSLAWWSLAPRPVSAQSIEGLEGMHYTVRTPATQNHQIPDSTCRWHRVAVLLLIAVLCSLQVLQSANGQEPCCAHICSVAKTAAERVAGTITGGITGFLIRAIGEVIDTNYEFLWYAMAAGGVGVLGVWLTAALPQGGSVGKLLVITFLLVFAGSDSVVRAFFIQSL